jgi:hypothetical protein
LRSGRERKSHARPEGADETFGVGHTFRVPTDPSSGVLAFEMRSRRSQPANAKYVTPAPIAARNRRRVNLGTIA